jgi:pre-mRNA-splicing factor ATP-dependent RNA helicase DHX38/PRP16
MSDVHRLEASENTSGGLVIKKKENEKKNDGFKIPASKFGLDVLAKKLKKERDMGLLTSFKDHDEDVDTKAETDVAKGDEEKLDGNIKGKIKNYRKAKIETPSHTGGVSSSARDHYKDRVTDKSKGIYASTKDKEHDRKSSRYSERDRDRNRDRNRDRDRDADRKRSRYDRSDRKSDLRSDRSSHRRRDEPMTPREPGGRSSVSKASWDDDDEEEYLRSKKKRSTWDFPTPDIPYRSRPDDSVRSYRSVKAASTSKRTVDDTPRATPAHKYNKWAADRKHSGATPRVDKTPSTKQPWETEEDRDLWEEEQIRLDREWYNMDEGYDDENNPFIGANADYLKKREEQIELKKRKRISAQQRQINKDNELWEKNRMITSGVVQSINVNEDFEEETVDRVHLLVHHTIPPFLDGRIV